MNTAAILAFFSGKSLEKATAALALVEQSVAQGFWLPGVSRSARAALTKANLAAKAAKKFGEDGGYEYGRVATPQGQALSHLGPDPRAAAFFATHMALSYGCLHTASWMRTLAGLPLIEKDHPEYVAYFRSYADAMIPLVAAIEKLDAARPTPVFTTMEASPTVSRTLTTLGATYAAVCPMEFSRENRLNEKTRVVESVPVCRLLWPEGTKHNTSRWGGCQCQACGHAIHKGDNWVPMVLTTGEGPKSLWVGRDCARTLFGVDYTGTLEIVGGRAA